MKIDKIISLAIQFLFSYYFMFLAPSCNNASQKTNPEKVKTETKSPIVNKPPSGFTDTLKITTEAAIFFNPDSLQLEKMKALMDSNVTQSIVHECYYQMRNARRVLKQIYPHVNLIVTENTRFLLFERSNGKREYIDLDSLKDPCGMLIFDRIKRAELIDMTNIETQLGFYFSR